MADIESDGTTYENICTILTYIFILDATAAAEDGSWHISLVAYDDFFFLCPPSNGQDDTPIDGQDDTLPEVQHFMVHRRQSQQIRRRTILSISFPLVLFTFSFYRCSWKLSLQVIPYLRSSLVEFHNLYIIWVKVTVLMNTYIQICCLMFLVYFKFLLFV